MKTKTETRLGVLLDGKIEKIDGDPRAILEATLSVSEYATARARALGGTVVQRTRTVTVSDWSDWEPRS